MKHTTLIPLALAATLASGIGLAQSAPGHHPDPQAQLKHLSVILELSAQQQAQLRDILTTHREALDARRAEGRQVRAERREARRADREAFEQQVAALLSDEQKARFEALKAERDAQRERRHGVRTGSQGEG
jgi:Spy/CpxP family protein refolding chaperone